MAIVGPSGAGKLTLARLLAGLDEPRDGVVSLGGCPVTDRDPAERRRQIALVTKEHLSRPAAQSGRATRWWGRRTRRGRRPHWMDVLVATTPADWPQR